MHYRVRGIALLAVTACTLAGAAQAQSEFLDIAMVQTDLGFQQAGQGAAAPFGDSPIILVKGAAGGWYVRAMTLSKTDGSRLGSLVDFAVPPGPCTPTDVCQIIFSEYFLQGRAIVLGEDRALVTILVSFDSDGTPVPGTPVCFPPDPVSPDPGVACALTELPGSAFGDNQARLFVGTESGKILMYAYSAVFGIVLTGVIDLLAGQPITALAPIPQSGGPVLGAAVGDQIVGIINPDILPAVKFGIINPDILPITDFAAVSQLGPTDPPTYIVFGDGVHGRVSRALLSGDAIGTSTLNTFPPDPIYPQLTSPPRLVALGSLLLVTDDGQSVYYDPDFDVLTGPSYCLAEVNNPGPAVCACAVTKTGDVNVNGSITTSDIIYLVNYVFKGGLTPQPCEAAGDTNCDGAVTSADILVDLIYCFKGGAPPCDVCTIIPDLWSCP